MSAFLKKIKSENQETASRDTKDAKEEDKPSMSSSKNLVCNNEGLSLFSGMTFNSDRSCQTKEQSHPTKKEKQASTELVESGVDFHIPQTTFESSAEKHIDEIDVQDKIQLDIKERDQKTGSDLVQLGKKKKKTQAKRPGYARDSKTSSSFDKRKDSAASKLSTYEIQVDGQKDDDYTFEKTETKQQPDVHLLQQETKCKKTTEIINQASSNNEVDPKSNIDNETFIDQEMTTTNHVFSQLYSIGTPSSSDENLNIEEPQEKNLLSINARKSHSDVYLEEGLHNTNENMSNYDSENENIQHHDGYVMELQTASKSNSFERINEEFEMKEMFLSQEKDDVGKMKEKTKKTQKNYDFRVDAEDKLTIMEQDMQFKISSLIDDEERLANLTVFLIKKYSNVETTMLDMQKELDHLIQEESNAIGVDNYDLAEELAVKIQKAKEDLENTKYKVPGADVKVQETLKLSLELIARALSIRRETQSSLEELREEQVSTLDHHNDDNSSKMSKEKQHLNLEKQRIERTRAHLALDGEHIEKEAKNLEEEVKERTQEYVAHKNELMRENQEIMQEISDLEQKLKILRLKESQCRDEIIAEELKIREVLEEFRPQKDVLDLQRKDLENQRKLLGDQEEALASSQKAYDKVIDEWNCKRIRLSEFLDNVQSSIESNNSMISNLEKKRGELEEFQCLKHINFSVDPALERSKASAKRSDQEIKTFRAKIHLSNRAITSLRKSLNEIEAQISDRNNAKETAKKERNFKEAKRLKEEIEALNKEGIDNQKKLENVLQDLNNDTEHLRNVEKDYGKVSEELKEEEFKSAIQLVNLATQVQQDLETNMERYASNDLLCTLLNAEIVTCQKLTKELCLKHNIAPPVPSFREKAKQDTDATPPNGDDNVVPCQNLPVDKEKLQCVLDELEVKLEAVVDLENYDEADILSNLFNFLLLCFKAHSSSYTYAALL